MSCLAVSSEEFMAGVGHFVPRFLVRLNTNAKASTRQCKQLKNSVCPVCVTAPVLTVVQDP